MFPQPLMNHTIIQMAYVVRDIRETAKDWQETFGIGPFFLLEDINITDPHYRGKPQEVDFSVAVCQTGDIHVEFIQQNCDSRHATAICLRRVRKASTMLVLLRRIMKKKWRVTPIWVLRLPLTALWGRWIFVMSIRQAKWDAWLRC